MQQSAVSGREMQTMWAKNDRCGWFPGIHIALVVLFLIIHGTQCDHKLGSSISERINNFGFRLYKNLLENKQELDKTGNFVFSPFYLHRTMAFVYKNTTLQARKDMKNVFEFTDDGFPPKDFIKTFRLKKFSNMSTLEKYVSYRDDKCITSAGIGFLLEDDIMKHSDAKFDHNKLLHMNINKYEKDEALVVMNYIFFGINWDKPFRTADTREADFQNTRDETMNIKLMCAENEYIYAESNALNAKIVKIPLQDRHLTFEVILPNDIDGLDDLMSVFNEASLKATDDELQPQKLKLCLPKFEISTENYIHMDVLKELGIDSLMKKGAFDMCNSTQKLNAVQYYSKVQIYEGKKTGTDEAEPPEDSNSPATEMTIDHPFLFTVRDKETGAIIFIGAARKPYEVDRFD